MIKQLMYRATGLFIALALVVTPALGQDMEQGAPDVVDTAIQADGFNTLVALVKQAGLVETLKGEGPFTIFAPTDEAFSKLPEETVNSLMKPENRDQLATILTYHVVPGKVMASDVTQLEEANTVEGSALSIQVKDGTVTLMGQNSANVIQTDIEASNGVIHVIDTVLLPPKEKKASM